jgi:Type IV secretion system pilin
MKKLKNLTSKLFLTIGGYNVDAPTGLRTEFQGNGALANIAVAAFFYIIPIVGIIGFLFFLWSGFEFLTSKGDPKALAAAKARLTYAVVGLVVIFSAYLITLFVTELFRIRRI